jgi:NAD(P)-dependent dehydrogenase (short-subunit alcohol dehydrogenase family)
MVNSSDKGKYAEGPGFGTEKMRDYEKLKPSSSPGPPRFPLRISEVAASNHVALVDGDIGEPATAAKIVETAPSRFRSIDVLVNNASRFFTRPFTNYTAEDFKTLVSTNVEGFLYVTQLFIKQMGLGHRFGHFG